MYIINIQITKNQFYINEYFFSLVSLCNLENLLKLNSNLILYTIGQKLH